MITMIVITYVWPYPMVDPVPVLIDTCSVMTQNVNVSDQKSFIKVYIVLFCIQCGYDLL